MNNDNILVNTFVRNRSETAFASLVTRHYRLVYSVCRREGCDSAMAEDVTQVVFLILSQKAKTIHNANSLSTWLFQTARLASRNALRHEQNLRKREETAMNNESNDLNNPEAIWTSISPVLHDAIQSLADRDKDIVLRRYYDDMSYREIANIQRITEDAARQRVLRAIEKLRRYLHRHGVEISASVLAVLMAENCLHSPSNALAENIIQSTVNPIANLHNPVLHSTLKALLIARLKIAAVYTVSILAGVGGLVGLSNAAQYREIPIRNTSIVSWTGPAHPTAGYLLQIWQNDADNIKRDLVSYHIDGSSKVHSSIGPISLSAASKTWTIDHDNNRFRYYTNPMIYAYDGNLFRLRQLRSDGKSAAFDNLFVGANQKSQAIQASYLYMRHMIDGPLNFEEFYTKPPCVVSNVSIIDVYKRYAAFLNVQEVKKDGKLSYCLTMPASKIYSLMPNNSMLIPVKIWFGSEIDGTIVPYRFEFEIVGVKTIYSNNTKVRISADYTGFIKIDRSSIPSGWIVQSSTSDLKPIGTEHTVLHFSRVGANHDDKLYTIPLDEKKMLILHD